MQITTPFFFLSSLLSVINAIKFASPDTSRPLNLSDPVVFRWIVDPSTSENMHPYLELTFNSLGSKWWLNSNRIDTRTVDSWTWDSPKYVMEMVAVEQVLSAGKNNWFGTSLHSAKHANESGGSLPLETEKFEIEGYPYLSAAGMTVPSIRLGLAAGVVTIAAYLAPVGS
ncbi:hypothetical protein DL764_004507 [Monosporascus ibericus]|uniref:Uncharacterized protein n=1 Tax=Monosporascus ibericus TaxID=155417 RepID=A0A4Q4TFQ0_9PEZI|nr:hypothetical protein DL764_004507 [Monosporascus ibericus]